MPESRRTVLGHAVMGLGLALRRLSLPLCGLAGVILGGWTMLHAAIGRGRDFPNLIPFHGGARVGLAAWFLAGIVTLAALLLALRLLAVTIGAVGWLLLPPDHRDMLGRLGPPASRAGARDDPPESGDNLQEMRFAWTKGESELPGWRLDVAQRCRKGRPWSPEEGA